MLELLNKADHIAMFIAGPTPIALPAGVDVEGGTVVIVEGANAFEGGAGRAQGNVTAYNVDNVVGFFHPLFQGYAIFRQGTPGDWTFRELETNCLSLNAN